MTAPKFDGQIAVVTGASDGIGKQIAIALANAGATVYALARSADKLQALSNEVSANIIGLTVDLTDPKDSARAFSHILVLFLILMSMLLRSIF